jgi:coproporphyrinogen III oxidase-like Fe-S oxidoreductase
VIEYSHPLYRPPSEASSLIFQVTIGCSFNHCTFCSMYRTKTFKEKPIDRVLTEIEATAKLLPQTRRVFLADGDALVRSTDDLLLILSTLYNVFPMLERVTCYALPKNLIRKPVKELLILRRSGLTMVYYGIESGNNDILKRITKGINQEQMISGLEKASKAGLAISATIILGLGGKQHWQEHIDGTVDLINRVKLDYLSTLQLHLDPSVHELFMERYERQDGKFSLQDDMGILQEQMRLVAGIATPEPIIFRSNHASNALPLKGNLPEDRDALLAALRTAQSGVTPLQPEWLRGL